MLLRFASPQNYCRLFTDGVYGHLTLASIGALLPLDVLIGTGILHEVAPRSTYKC
jgi:hypothetical protein